MSVCYLGLGGNLGDVRDAFRESLRRLRAAGVEATALSGLYRTRAVGAAAGPPFLNAAAEVRTALEPEPLLDVLQDVERALGRTREVHWGPRTIDLDILLYDTRIVRTPRLIIPHPACWYRRFVLDPLAEIAGPFRHPQRGLTIEQLRDRLGNRPLTIRLTGADAGFRDAVAAQVAGGSGGQIQVVVDDDSACDVALTFCFGGASTNEVSPSSLVQVPDSGDPVRFVMDLVQAAVDTPERVAEAGAWNPPGK